MKLKTKFIKRAIENEKYEYCNTSKALACVEIANEHAISFAQYVRNNPNIFNNGWSMKMVLDYFNENYNS